MSWERQGSSSSLELKYVNIAIDIGPKRTQATWVHTTKDAGPRLRGLHAWPRYNVGSQLRRPSKTKEDKLIDPRLRDPKDPRNPPLIERDSTILYDLDSLGEYGERLYKKGYDCMGVPINLLFSEDDISGQDAQHLRDIRVRVMMDFLKEVQREMKDATPNNALPRNYKAVYNISLGQRDVTEDVRKVFDELAILMGLKPEDLRITCAASDIVYADIEDIAGPELIQEDGDLHMAVHHLRDRIEFTKFKLKDHPEWPFYLEVVDTSYVLVPLDILLHHSWEYAVGTRIYSRGRLHRPPNPLDFRTSFGLIEGLDWVFDKASGGKTDTLFRMVESGRPIVGTVMTARTVHERVLFHINNLIVAEITKLDATNAEIHLRSGIYTPMMGKAVSMFHGDRLYCWPMRRAWFPGITELSQEEFVVTEWVEDISTLMDLWFPHSRNTPVQASTPPLEEALTGMCLGETDSDWDLAKD